MYALEHQTYKDKENMTELQQHGKISVQQFDILGKKNSKLLSKLVKIFKV